MAEKMPMPYSAFVDPDEAVRAGRVSSGHWGAIPGKVQPQARSVIDPEEHIEKQLRQALGVDYPILNAVHRGDMNPDERWGMAQMRAQNEVFVDHFLDASDDYFGLISIMTHQPDKVAEEIDRYGDEDRIVGALIHPGGQDRGLGHPRYDPIYAALEDNGMSAAFHTTANGMMWEMPGFFKGADTSIETHGLNHPWAMMRTVASLVVNGAPVKFPDLNFVMYEGGIGWVPFMMARLNREYSVFRTQAPLLEKMPEDYIRENFWFTTQPLGEFNRRSSMANVIDTIGPENIIFSSDHPHFDFDNPETIRGFFQHLSEEEQQQVFAGNAIEAFHLPISV